MQNSKVKKINFRRMKDIIGANAILTLISLMEFSFQINAHFI